MVEKKEKTYKQTNSEIITNPTYQLLKTREKHSALCLLKMRNKALPSTVRTLTFSCHVMLRWWMGTVMMAVDIW